MKSVKEKNRLAEHIFGAIGSNADVNAFANVNVVFGHVWSNPGFMCVFVYACT